MREISVENAKKTQGLLDFLLLAMSSTMRRRLPMKIDKKFFYLLHIFCAILHFTSFPRETTCYKTT